MTALFRARCRPGDSGGFTLIEMVVALAIISVVLTSFGLFTAGVLRSGQHADARTRANQLAQEQIEALQSLPYSMVGFYSADGAASTCGGESTVSLSGTRPSSGQQSPTPTQTITRDGVPYTVTTCITWRNDSSINASSTGYDFKHFVVTVSWAGGQSVTYGAFRSPTTSEVTPSPLGSAAASPTSSSTPTSSPSSTPSSSAPAANCTTSAAASPGQMLSQTGQLTTKITVTVSTAQAASSVTGTYPLASGSGTLSFTGDSSKTTWTATVPAATQTFTAGTEVFSTSVALSGCATQTPSASVTLAAYQALSFVTPNPTSLTVCKSNNNIKTATTVSVEIKNMDTTGTASILWQSAQGSNVQASGTVALSYSGTTGTNGGPIYTGTLPTSASFSGNKNTFTVTAQRSSDTSATSSSSYSESITTDNSC